MPQRPNIPIGFRAARRFCMTCTLLPRSLLPDGAERSQRVDARAYLDQRGVSVDLIEAFETGFL